MEINRSTSRNLLQKVVSAPISHRKTNIDVITIGICTVNYGVFIEMLKHAQILEVDLLISTNNKYF